MKPLLKIALIGAGGYLAYDLYRLKKFSDSVVIAPTKDINIVKATQFKGLYIDAVVRITNNSTKDIPLNSIIGEVISGSTVFAKLSSLNKINLKPKSSQSVTLRFEVKTSNILSSLASAIRSERVTINYVAEIRPKLLNIVPVPFSSSGSMEYSIAPYLAKIYDAVKESKNNT